VKGIIKSFFAGTKHLLTSQQQRQSTEAKKNLNHMSEINTNKIVIHSSKDTCDTVSHHFFT